VTESKLGAVAMAATQQILDLHQKTKAENATDPSPIQGEDTLGSFGSEVVVQAGGVIGHGLRLMAGSS
jgi:hypothetical protein